MLELQLPSVGRGMVVTWKETWRKFHSAGVLGILYILIWTLLHRCVLFVKIHPMVCL